MGYKSHNLVNRRECTSQRHGGTRNGADSHIPSSAMATVSQSPGPRGELRGGRRRACRTFRPFVWHRRGRGRHRHRRRGRPRVGAGTVFLDYNSDDLERLLSKRARRTARDPALPRRSPALAPCCLRR